MKHYTLFPQGQQTKADEEQPLTQDEAMERHGIEYVFGLPGGAAMPVYDALVDFCELTGVRAVLPGSIKA